MPGTSSIGATPDKNILVVHERVFKYLPEDYRRDALELARLGKIRIEPEPPEKK